LPAKGPERKYFTGSFPNLLKFTGYIESYLKNLPDKDPEHKNFTGDFSKIPDFSGILSSMTKIGYRTG